MMSREDYEANWNRQTDGHTDRKYHILSQADALTKHNVPVRCILFTGTVSVRCILFTGTVSVRCILLTGTLAVNDLFPFGMLYKPKLDIFFTILQDYVLHFQEQEEFNFQLSRRFCYHEVATRDI